MEKLNIAIIGHGFVGKAVEAAFTNNHCSIQLIDPKYGNSTKDLKSDTDVVFVCVPTPMSPDGSIDGSIIKSVFQDLQTFTNLILVKSTITPDIANSLEKLASYVYNPEYLREATAVQDYINAPFHVFGVSSHGSTDYLVLLTALLEHSNCKLINTKIHICTINEAILTKYGINSFLATKVAFFNQLYDLSEDLGCNFRTISDIIGNDERVGHSHTSVPGFDGKRGFGGSCFPKDTKAITNFSDKLSIIKHVTKVNDIYRSKYALSDREKEQNVTFQTGDINGIY